MQINDNPDSKNSANDKFAPVNNSITDEQIASNPMFRVTIATAEGVEHFLPGVFIAVAQDAQHPDCVAKDIALCSALGIAMRVALPKIRAAQLLIGTVLALRASEDAATPFIGTYKKAIRAQNLHAVTCAGDELGTALGRFAVDSAIGIAAGGTSEKITENCLLAGLSHKNYLHFEYDKSAFWNCSPIAKFFNLPAVCINSSFKRLSHVFPAVPTVQLSLDEKLSRICNAGKSISAQIENERFYQYGPITGSGERVGFSNYLDEVLKRTPDKINAMHSDSAELKAKGLGEFSADNMSKLATVVRNCMSGYTSKEVQLLDIKERLNAPIFSVSDRTRSGALLPSKFQHSCKQLSDLIAGVKNQSQLNNLLYILDLHSKSAMQDELKLASASHLNIFAGELHKVFVDGIKKSGVSSRVLLGSAPSRVAITDDHGYVNFTIPSIPGVIDRPVTVFPRNQTSLESVLSGVNRHEMLGHDYIWGDLNGFAYELKEVVLPAAVKHAMQTAKVKDSNIEVPGLGAMKKSAFYLKILQAQCNENISDLVGTASGGADSALSLGLLLQSLRRDGKLETGSFISSRFEDSIEPHGIDRCRIKCCAEQMRQLAPHNTEVLKQARALDMYADSASRSGRYYIWANADTGGQITIPMKEWDLLLPHIVRTQLETNFKSLEGRRLKDILPDMSHITDRIEALARIMQHDLANSKEVLPAMFDPAQYSIGEVYAAGLRAWMGMTEQGVEPDHALAKIGHLSNKLCDLYLKKFR